MMQKKNMQKFRLLSVFVMVWIFSVSCRSTRQVAEKTKDYSATSEHIVSFKDTTFYAPKSETALKLRLSDFGFKTDSSFKPNLKMLSKPKVLTQQNGNARVKIEVSQDTITATATCDSLAIAAKIRKEVYNQVIKDIQTEKVKEVKSKGFTLLHLIITGLISFVVAFILSKFLTISIHLK